MVKDVVGGLLFLPEARTNTIAWVAGTGDDVCWFI